jgi:hypothetical protein
MLPGESNGRFDGSANLIDRIAAGIADRMQPGLAEPIESSQLDFSEQGVFVSKMAVEGSDSQSSTTRNGIAVDPLGPTVSEEAQSGCEESGFCVLEFCTRHCRSFLIY